MSEQNLTADLRAVPRTQVDITTLNQEIDAIQSLENCTYQEKTAKFLELLTSLTNAAATAFFYIDSDDHLVIGPRVISKQALTWHDDITDFLKHAAKKSTDSKQVEILALPNKPHVTVISSPRANPAGEHCALVQLLELHDQTVESFVVISQLFLALIEQHQTGNQMHGALSAELFSHILNADDDTHAYSGLVDSISSSNPGVISWLGQASNNSIQLKAISKASKFNKRGQYANVLNNAMTECKKSNLKIKINELTQSKQSPICQNLYNTIKKKNIILLPIASSLTNSAYIMGFASDDFNQLNKVVDQIDRQSLLLGDALSNKTSGALAQIQRTQRFIKNKTNTWFKSIVIAVPLLAIALLFLPVTYKIKSPIVVEPLEKRFIAVPFNGVLKDVNIDPGEVVKKDQILAVLDERELQWEYTQLQAKYDSAIKQKDIEMAADDTAAMQLSKFEAEEYKAKIDLIEYQLEHLKITSPIDGQLVSGDIKNRKGSAVSVGENLFEIAPLDRIMIEIEVPAEEISYVEKGMPVSLRINAIPGKDWDSHIQNIHLRSRMRQSSNVFIVETELENHGLKMRPGMDGYAKILTGKKFLGWVLFHRAWNKLVEFIFW